MSWHPIPGEEWPRLWEDLFSVHVCLTGMTDAHWMGSQLVIASHCGICSSLLPSTRLWRGLWPRAYIWWLLSVNSQSRFYWAFIIGFSPWQLLQLQIGYSYTQGICDLIEETIKLINWLETHKPEVRDWKWDDWTWLRDNTSTPYLEHTYAVL